VRDGRIRSGRRAARVLRVAVPLVVLALAACVSGPPNNIFDLSAPALSEPPRGHMQVLVPEPTTVRALDTDRIAARPTPAEYAYVPGAVWSDRLPKLIQARLVQTLQNSGRVRAVGVPGQGLMIDYQVVLDIRAFEFTSQEGAVVDFAVRLMDDRNGRVIRSQVFRKVVAPPSTESGAIVYALDQAMQQAFTEIVAWAFP
jgi:cholesterol transport system auxiliary component